MDFFKYTYEVLELAGVVRHLLSSRAVCLCDSSRRCFPSLLTSADFRMTVSEDSTSAFLSNTEFLIVANRISTGSVPSRSRASWVVR